MACSSMSYTPFAFYGLMFSMCLFCLFYGFFVTCAETMDRPTTSNLLSSANNVDEDDGDWQDTSYTQILLLLLV